jgi:hypothetical protein
MPIMNAARQASIETDYWEILTGAAGIGVSDGRINEPMPYCVALVFSGNAKAM